MSDETGLYAVFLEFRKGNARAQWMLFPPAMREYDAPGPDGRGRFIKRRMDHRGHRAKWETTEKLTYGELAAKLKSQLDQYESTSWVPMQPVVIRLEHDDYLKAWAAGSKATTPYKALRHVEAVTVKRGYRLTD